MKINTLIFSLNMQRLTRMTSLSGLPLPTAAPRRPHFIFYQRSGIEIRGIGAAGMNAIG